MRISDFKLAASDFATFGRGLRRPECVWIDAEAVWVSDERGGVARVRADDEPELRGSGIADPNGFSRRPDGSFVVAGLSDGALHLIARDGATRRMLDSIDGKALGTVNYACADGLDRIWVSVMTRALPWHAALTTTVTDGYIVRVEDNGAHCSIVADGLDLTNEVKVSPDGRYLYAAETFGCRIARFPIRADGSLGAKEIFGPSSLGRGAFPDGITFDAAGNLWITTICQNGLIVLDPKGNLHVVFSDPVDAAVDAIARGVEERNGALEQLGACASPDGPLRLPTSIAFGARDGRTAFVGNLLSPHLPTFRLPQNLA